jgi:hypothetical protein
MSEDGKRLRSLRDVADEALRWCEVSSRVEIVVPGNQGMDFVRCDGSSRDEIIAKLAALRDARDALPFAYLTVADGFIEGNLLAENRDSPDADALLADMVRLRARQLGVRVAPARS